MNLGLARTGAAALLSLILITGCSDREATGDVVARASPAVDSTIAATATPTNSAPPTATPTATSGPPGAEGPAEPVGQRALAHVEELAGRIGPRVAGTAGEDAGAAYIAETLRSYGYEVEVMRFRYTGDRFRAGAIEAGGQTFPVLTMDGSPGGSVTAPTVYVGLADGAGIAGQELAGRIAIAERGVLTFGEKYASVRAGGAVGLVVVNNEEGEFIGNLPAAAEFPVVAAAGSAGAALFALAESGETVTLSAPGAENESVNVIARTPGGECRVLVGGHHDTVPASPGALDNASGTATTLELARGFAADGLDEGLCFATFGAEESGLFGSEALAERMAADGALPEVMVNLDMTGLGASIDLIGAPELVQLAAGVADGLGIGAVPAELAANLGSDHQSFQQRGVAVIFLTTSELGQFHTPGDTVETLRVEDLERAGDLAYGVIRELVG